MVASFDGSPKPNHKMNSGKSAIFGIGNSAAISGRPVARASDHTPIAKPSAMPHSVPSSHPRAMRRSDAATCWSS